MIIDLERFVTEEEPYWQELEAMLRRMEDDSMRGLNLTQARRLHYLYERTSADLGRVMTFAAEPKLRTYLESLVARAYGEIHEVRRTAHRFAPVHWAVNVFPNTFRRHIWAFWVSVAITLVGALFGGGAVAFDTGAKGVLLPYSHLQVDPRERVREEEKDVDFDPRAASKARGTSFYFTHNTRVSIVTLALGVSWGIGTMISLFANGVLLGAVVFDYFQVGEGVFLVGWLLPHGSVEIPAILLAGQGGLVLGRALIGWGVRAPVKERLRNITPDLVTLIAGIAIMLAWAGFVEAFLSQYHEPVVPYALKIALGVVELVLLIAYLTFAGRKWARMNPEAP